LADLYRPPDSGGLFIGVTDLTVLPFIKFGAETVCNCRLAGMAWLRNDGGAYGKTKQQEKP